MSIHAVISGRPYNALPTAAMRRFSSLCSSTKKTPTLQHENTMILISGLIELAEADIDTMKVAATTMALETRMETGCIQYAFYQDIENPAIFRVFEEWESMDALQAHFGSPHMKVFRETLSQAAIVRRDLKKYSVTHSAPLT